MVIDGMTRYDLGKRYQQHPHRCGHTVLTANKELHGARPFTVFRVPRSPQVSTGPSPLCISNGLWGTHLVTSLAPQPH